MSTLTTATKRVKYVACFADTAITGSASYGTTLQQQNVPQHTCSGQKRSLTVCPLGLVYRTETCLVLRSCFNLIFSWAGISLI